MVCNTFTNLFVMEGKIKIKDMRDYCEVMGYGFEADDIIKAVKQVELTFQKHIAEERIKQMNKVK